MLGTCSNKAPKNRRENCSHCKGTGQTGLFGSKGLGLVTKPCAVCSPTGAYVETDDLEQVGPCEFGAAEASPTNDGQSRGRMLPPTAANSPSDRTYHSCVSSWESSGFVPMPRSNAEPAPVDVDRVTTPTAGPSPTGFAGDVGFTPESPANLRLRPPGAGALDIAGAQHVQIAATEASPQYEGQFLDSKPHGHGCERWTGNASYEGQYRAGKKHGRGRFVWANGSCYDGEFLDNKMSGIGVISWSDGSTYEGEWKHGVMHGRGFFKWADQRTYDGEYQNDLKHGQGIFRWPDGRQFDGQWSGGNQEGTGTYTTANGQKRTGHWKGGKLLKWVSAIEPSATAV